jgi:hypothetical protein
LEIAPRVPVGQRQKFSAEEANDTLEQLRRGQPDNHRFSSSGGHRRRYNFAGHPRATGALSSLVCENRRKTAHAMKPFSAKPHHFVGDTHVMAAGLRRTPARQRQFCRFCSRNALTAAHCCARGQAIIDQNYDAPAHVNYGRSPRYAPQPLHLN